MVSGACLLAGAGAGLRSADDFGLVLNAVAATFILQIDDAIYLLLVPDASRKMAAAMPAGDAGAIAPAASADDQEDDADDDNLGI